MDNWIFTAIEQGIKMCLAGLLPEFKCRHRNKRFDLISSLNVHVGSAPLLPPISGLSPISRMTFRRALLPDHQQVPGALPFARSGSVTQVVTLRRVLAALEEWKITSFDLFTLLACPAYVYSVHECNPLRQ